MRSVLVCRPRSSAHLDEARASVQAKSGHWQVVSAPFAGFGVASTSPEVRRFSFVGREAAQLHDGPPSRAKSGIEVRLRTPGAPARQTYREGKVASVRRPRSSRPRRSSREARAKSGWEEGNRTLNKRHFGAADGVGLLATQVPIYCALYAALSDSAVFPWFLLEHARFVDTFWSTAKIAPEAIR